MIRSLWRSVGLAAVAMVVAAGCGDGRVKFNVAPTEGKVVCEGQPVPYVTVFFEPLPDGNKALTGKSAVGYVDGKGSFVLTTYDQNDGAVVGKHRVRVGPPMGEKRSDFKCDCVLDERVDVMEVTVEKGRNTFEVVLKKASQAEQMAAAKAAAAAAAEEE